MTNIPDQLTSSEGNRLDELRKKGFNKLSDDEIREYQNLAQKQINYMRFRRGNIITNIEDYHV